MQRYIKKLTYLELSRVTEVDIDGGEVGNAAQTTFGLGVDYRISDNFSVDTDYRHYNSLFANVGAVKNNLKLPSYGLVDLGISYRFNFKYSNNKSLNFRFNINNLLDEEYLSNLRTNVKTGDKDASETTFKGIDTANKGYFGLGRTWNASVRFRF